MEVESCNVGGQEVQIWRSGGATMEVGTCNCAVQRCNDAAKRWNDGG